VKTTLVPNVYKDLFQTVRPYLRILAVSVAAMLLGASLEPAIPALMRPLIDETLIARKESYVWLVPVGLGVVFFFKSIFEYVSNIGTQWVANKAVSDLRIRLFEKQLNLPFLEHKTRGQGELISRIAYDTAQVSGAVSTAWITLVRDSLVVLALLAYLFYLAWHLTLLILILAPTLGLLISIVAKKIRVSSHRLQSLMADFTRHLQQAFSGVLDIKLFGLEGRQTRQFSEISEAVRKETMRAARAQALSVPLVQVISALAVGLVLLIALNSSRSHQLSPGEFVAYVTALAMIFEPIRRLTNVTTALQKGLAAAQSIFGSLREGFEGVHHSSDNEIVDGGFQGDKGIDLTQPALISLRNVSFRYPLQNKDSIVNLSIELSGPGAYAIVGTSGSGKTTLLHLMLGLIQPSSGTLLVNQLDPARIPPQGRRKLFSVVGQTSCLFDGTLASNIVFDDVIKPNDDRLYTCLERARLRSFVDTLSDKEHTPIGVGGIQLSGGQQQRLAIARSLYSGARIYIFDEITSALDLENGQFIHSVMRELSKEHLVIIVSHEISSLEWVKELFVLQDGTLKGRGSFRDLVAKNDIFRTLLPRIH
jgi:subfamily B ATP-binding cassette protein MsbA